MSNRRAQEPDAEQLLEAAVEAARVGGAILERHFRSGRLQVSVKAENDFVTEADRASERALVETLLGHFPSHRILAEEGSASPAATSELEWVIDPLDGTTNFLHGLPVWALSIACRRGSELLAGVVLDPSGGNLFAAARGGGATWNGAPMRVAPRQGLDGVFLATGYPFRAHAALDLYLSLFRSVFLQARAIRRCGAAALDLAYTAAGVYEGFFELRLSPWDIAAGALLIREAGGAVVNLDGGELDLDRGNVLAGPPGVVEELVARARAAGVDESSIDRLVPVPPSPAG